MQHNHTQSQEAVISRNVNPAFESQLDIEAVNIAKILGQSPSQSRPKILKRLFSRSGSELLQNGFDADLLKFTRSLITSQDWLALPDKLAVQYEDGRYDPKPRKGLAGASIIVDYKIPQHYQFFLDKWMEPIADESYITRQAHVSSRNIGTVIPIETNFSKIASKIKRRLSNAKVRPIVDELLATVSIEPGLHLIHPVSIVMWTSAKTTRLLNEIGCLIDNEIDSLQEYEYAADRPSVLGHATYARIVDIISEAQANIMADQTQIPVEKEIHLQAHLSLMIFSDRKGMIKPHQLFRLA